MSSDGCKMELGYQSPVLSPSSATTSTWGEWIMGTSSEDIIPAGQRAVRFYKYIFTFLLDVAITNAFILMKHYCPSCPFSDMKSFRLQLAKELMGVYCSRCRRGRGGAVIHPLPYCHFPIKMEDENHAPKRKRGHCALHAASHLRASSTWYCRECDVWPCHNGDPANDCFMKWHTRHHI